MILSILKRYTRGFSTMMLSVLILGMGISMVPQYVHAQALGVPVGQNIRDNEYIPQADSGSCQTSLKNVASNPIGRLLLCVSLWGVNIFTSVLAWALNWVVDITDTLIEASVLNFADSVKPGGGIRAGWEASRNIANLFFIFLLLYAAAGYMLNLPSIGKGRDYIVKIIIVAIFINFSFSLTSIVIDVSNLAAASIYDAIKGNEEDTTLGDRLYKQLSTFDGVSRALPEDALDRTNKDLDAKELSAKHWKDIEGLTPAGLLISSVGGAAFLAFAIFAFAAGGILLLLRAVMLLFSLVLAPIAFLTAMFPKFDYINEWWTGLINHAVFAPAYLLMMYIALKAVEGGGVLGAGDSVGGSFVTLFNYIIFIGLVVGGVFVAQKLSVMGAGAAGKALEGYAGYLGRGVARNRLTDGLRLQVGKLGEAIQQTGLGRVPIISGISNAAASQSRQLVATRKKELEDQNLSATALENLSESITDPTTAAAAYELLKSKERKGDTIPGRISEGAKTRAQSRQKALGLVRRDLSPEEYIAQAGNLSKDDLEKENNEIFGSHIPQEQRAELLKNFLEGANNNKIKAVLDNNKLRDDFIDALEKNYSVAGLSGEELRVKVDAQLSTEGFDLDPQAIVPGRDKRRAQLEKELNEKTTTALAEKLRGEELFGAAQWVRSPIAGSYLARKGYSAPVKNAA